MIRVDDKGPRREDVHFIIIVIIITITSLYSKVITGRIRSCSMV